MSHSSQWFPEERSSKVLRGRKQENSQLWLHPISSLKWFICSWRILSYISQRYSTKMTKESDLRHWSHLLKPLSDADSQDGGRLPLKNTSSSASNHRFWLQTEFLLPFWGRALLFQHASMWAVPFRGMLLMSDAVMMLLFTYRELFGLSEWRLFCFSPTENTQQIHKIFNNKATDAQTQTHGQHLQIFCCGAFRHSSHELNKRKMSL